MVDARQFIQLWLAVRDVQLTDQQDVVSLHGNLAKLTATASPILWQLEQTQMDDGCEGKGAKYKCKIFLWLFRQDRLPVVDRIIKHGGHGNQWRIPIQQSYAVLKSNRWKGFD